MIYFNDYYPNNIPFLKGMKIIHIFEFNKDNSLPLLFICKNELDFYFVGYCFNEKDSKDINLFHVSRTSLLSFCIKNNRKSYRYSILDFFSKFCYDVFIVDINNGKSHISQIDYNYINKKTLPAKSTKLKLKKESIEDFIVNYILI